MTADRIKEIQNETAFPDSISVCQALMKVWNECEQQSERMYSEVFEWLSSKDYLSDKMEFIQKEFEQFKKK